MTIEIKPLGDRILIEPVEREPTTALGIVLPETIKERPQEAKVLAVGPGRWGDRGQRLAVDVSVGDRILFSKYAGTEIKMDNRKLLILQESDILAILESEA